MYLKTHTKHPMLSTADRAFSILPFVIIAYHLRNASSSMAHFTSLINIVLTYIIGSILKAVFRVHRRQKDYAYRPMLSLGRLSTLKMDYGFPSTHAMFYFQYFLHCPCAITLLFFLCGIALRISQQHHTQKEVVWGCVFAFTIKAVLTGFRVSFEPCWQALHQLFEARPFL